MVGGLDHKYGLWYHTSWASQGALVVKNPPANAEEVKRPGFNSGLPPGRYRGGGHSNLLHYSCLENPMDRGTWRATVYGVAESDMTEQLSTHMQVVPDTAKHWKF